MSNTSNMMPDNTTTDQQMQQSMIVEIATDHFEVNDDNDMRMRDELEAFMAERRPSQQMA